MARKETVVVPLSNIKKELAQLLSKEGYLGKIVVVSDGKVKKKLSVDLIYKGKLPKLTDIERVSKIARRIYVKRGKIPKVLGGLGLLIVSTPSGLMTDNEARKKKLGGEIICKVW